MLASKRKCDGSNTRQEKESECVRELEDWIQNVGGTENWREIAVEAN